MRWMLFLGILMLALPATAGASHEDCNDDDRDDRGQTTCGVGGCEVTASVVSSSAQAETCPGGGS